MNESPARERPKNTYTALDFFAGSGLVTEALSPWFNVVWANDVSAKKARTYAANHGEGHFVFEDIKNISGTQLPPAILAWASFPCQDLSLAGKIGGIHAPRSGLVWEWLRVLDELDARPPILVAENVLGLLSSKGGAGYIDLHNALTERGYNVGPLLIDARRFLPQSRPRVFVVAARHGIPIKQLPRGKDLWAQTGKVFSRLRERLDNVVPWDIEPPKALIPRLEECIEKDAPFPKKEWQEHNLSLILEKRLKQFDSSKETISAGYRRIRNGRQVLEIRFDGIAGCLRTPCGGSSKQLLIFKAAEGFKIRFMTAREAARLMGAPDSYKLPGTYLDGYMAMGDAVAMPAARHLAKYLLHPLAEVACANVRKHQEAV
ncbi:MAG: DNA cytosine methyltransferase [Synergistaceae bacterium]|jgi:DNA (cytosine-5)-methyltransferase 1|nr:DNA cytosine methyltransferase [Synergistaceae bacterium]